MNLKFIMLMSVQLFLLNICTAQNKQNVVETETSLHYIIRESKDTVEKSPLLFLLHGHGSNENDLFSLEKNIPDNWTVIS